MRMNDVLRKAVTVGPTDHCAVAAAAMRDQGAASALVIDGTAIIGVITEHDLTTKIVAENRMPGECLVADVMTSMPAATNEHIRGRIMDVLGSPASSLEDAEGVYELALTGTPIDLTLLPGEE